MVLGQGACYGYATLLKSELVFNSHPLENLLENWQKFDGGFLDEPELLVSDDAHFRKGFVLDQLFCVVRTHVFSVVHQPVRDADGLVCVERRLPVLVDLTKQCAHLHMRLARVLVKFESKGGLVWIIEELLDLVSFKVSEALLQTGGALVKRTELLVAERHVVHRQQKNDLVVGVGLSPNLLEHSLSFLKQNETLFEALLRNEVHCALTQLVDHHWHLVYTPTSRQVRKFEPTYLPRGRGPYCKTFQKSREPLALGPSPPPEAGRPSSVALFFGVFFVRQAVLAFFGRPLRPLSLCKQMGLVRREQTYFFIFEFNFM